MRASTRIEVASADSHWLWWRSAADGSFVAMLLFLVIPETLTGKPYIGPFPVYFLIFYAGVFFLALERWIDGHFLSSWGRLFAVGWLYMTAIGLARGHGFKYIALDASAFLGIIAGVEWASARSGDGVLRQWRTWMVMFLMILILTIIGLRLGIVEPSRVSGRLYVYSLYRSCFFLAILIPPLWAARRCETDTVHVEWLEGFLLVAAMVVPLIAAHSTAARSLLLQGIVVILLCLRVHWLRFRALKMLLLFTGAALAAVLVSTGAIGLESLGLLGTRLGHTEVQGEIRWLEVGMLWEQMSALDLLTGRGFGSRFHSPVVVDGSNLALHPHVAVMAFLFKGGLPLLVIVVIMPAVLSLQRLVRGSQEPRLLGWCGSVVMFLLMASLSTAWEFFFLFLYGASWYGFRTANTGATDRQ